MTDFTKDFADAEKIHDNYERVIDQINKTHTIYDDDWVNESDESGFVFLLPFGLSEHIYGAFQPVFGDGDEEWETDGNFWDTESRIQEDQTDNSPY
jgi:hypothetical protein